MVFRVPAQEVAIQKLEFMQIGGRYHFGYYFVCLVKRSVSDRLYVNTGVLRGTKILQSARYALVAV